MLRLFLLITVCTVLSGYSQGEADFHEFTAKTGKKVLARLLAISEDQRTIRIQREDGIEFDSEVVTLCLDDQQFVKDWIKNRPEDSIVPVIDATDYRIEVNLAKKSLDSDRHPVNSSYTVEQKKNVIEISIRNISREALVGAKLEYVIIWERSVNVSREIDGSWKAYYSSGIGPVSNSKLIGEIEIETLAFNREAELVTKPYELNRMMYSSEVYREDEFKAVAVRVLSPSGAVIDEQRMGESWVESIEWEKLVSPPEPANE